MTIYYYLIHQKIYNINHLLKYVKKYLKLKNNDYYNNIVFKPYIYTNNIVSFWYQDEYHIQHDVDISLNEILKLKKQLRVLKLEKISPSWNFRTYKVKEVIDLLKGEKYHKKFFTDAK